MARGFSASRSISLAKGVNLCVGGGNDHHHPILEIDDETGSMRRTRSRSSVVDVNDDAGSIHQTRSRSGTTQVVPSSPCSPASSSLRPSPWQSPIAFGTTPSEQFSHAGGSPKSTNAKRRKESLLDTHKTFTWVGQEAKGTFPGASVPLLDAEFPHGLTDVDISRNAIAGIDVKAIFVQLPKLQRLNLSDNLLTSLSCVVPLGVLPHLEDLDIRGNPCCPNPSAVTSRSRLLANLLAPEASNVPRIVAAAQEAREARAKRMRFAHKTVHKSRHSIASSHPASSSKCKATVKSGSLGLEPPGRGSGKLHASSSAPVLLQQLDAQPSWQERPYRALHMQGNGSLMQAERAARQHLLEIGNRCKLPDNGTRDRHAGRRQDWKPQHVRDMKRRVGGCLPRAHLYNAVVGSCYDPPGSHQEERAPHRGAGASDWFPSLRVLNGAMVTVKDLEDAGSFADDLLGSNVSGEHCISESEKEGDTSRFDDMSQKEGEDYHRYLMRVRTTFLHYWNDKKGGRQRRHYSDEYERWLQKREAKKDEEDAASDEDSTLGDTRFPSQVAKASKSLISPANSASTRAPTTFLSPLTQTESVLDTAWDASQKEGDTEFESPDNCSSESNLTADKYFETLEVDMWAEQRNLLKHLEEGGVIEDGIEDDEVDDNDVVRDIGFDRQSLSSKTESLLSKSGATRPKSASLLRKPELEAHKSAWQPSRTTTGSFLRRVVPHDNFFADKERDRKLKRTYATYAKERVRELPDGVRAVMHPELHLEIDAQKYGSQGARFEDDDDASSDGSNAEALAKLRALGLGKRGSGDVMASGRTLEQWLRQLADDYPDKHNCISDAIEPPVNSKMPSSLYVCKLHSNPLDEKSWQLREAWLSASGRVWLSAKDANKNGSAVLYLGGCTVRDFNILQVKPGGEEAVASIGGKTVYPFKIDTPGARYARRRYFAARDFDTRSMWIRICNNLVPTD